MFAWNFGGRHWEVFCASNSSVWATFLSSTLMFHLVRQLLLMFIISLPSCQSHSTLRRLDLSHASTQTSWYGSWRRSASSPLSSAIACILISTCYVAQIKRCNKKVARQKHSSVVVGAISQQPLVDRLVWVRFVWVMRFQRLDCNIDHGISIFFVKCTHVACTRYLHVSCIVLLSLYNYLIFVIMYLRADNTFNRSIN